MLPLVRPHSDESSHVNGRRQVMNDSGRKATTFVFAGYKKEMDEFVQYNAGLESRIKVLRCYFHLGFLTPIVPPLLMLLVVLFAPSPITRPHGTL